MLPRLQGSRETGTGRAAGVPGARPPLQPHAESQQDLEDPACGASTVGTRTPGAKSRALVDPVGWGHSGHLCVLLGTQPAACPAGHTPRGSVRALLVPVTPPQVLTGRAHPWLPGHSPRGQWPTRPPGLHPRPQPTCPALGRGPAAAHLAATPIPAGEAGNCGSRPSLCWPSSTGLVWRFVDWREIAVLRRPRKL